MFEFGIAKKKELCIKDIMLPQVEDKWYISKEYLSRFVEDPSEENSCVNRAGYVLYENMVGNGSTAGKHQDNRVYDSCGIAPTVMARVRPIMRVLCPPITEKGTVIYKGKEYSIRWLNPQECWRLQGLDDELYFKAEKKLKHWDSKLFERTGRAICIPMLESIFKEFLDPKDKIQIFEAFAGIGSQRIALNNLKYNYESVGIMEVDRYGLLAYDAIHNDQNIDYSINKTDEEMIEEMKAIHIAYNFSSNRDEMPKKHEDIVELYNASKRSNNFGDIRLTKVEELPDFNFFTYSFPCKNISVAGTHKGFEKGSGTQSSLVWDCERIIEAKRPKYLMLENVKNICGKENIEDFKKWLEILSNLGYKNSWSIYNAKDYGVPQNRERVIVISVLKN